MNYFLTLNIPKTCDKSKQAQLLTKLFTLKFSQLKLSHKKIEFQRI